MDRRSKSSLLQSEAFLAVAKQNPILIFKSKAMNSDYLLDQEFKDINFEEKDIKYKEFENCTFYNCDFTKCTFQSVHFVDCNFFDCNL